ncbi:isochorismatase family protein [Paraburkholderia dilworthii]|uniref:Cysteine hydrolase n=1 Tax=Paraburkholderia dilworthii TaxID=948106 RepID=A0ABW9D4T6_9BURK
MHKINIPDTIVARAVARRGSVCVYDSLEPTRTALLVVDLQNGFVAPGYPGELPVAREIVCNVNRLAAALRDAGGHVFWIKHTQIGPGEPAWDRFVEFASDWGQGLGRTLVPGHAGHELYPELDFREGDDVVLKTRFSAFIQGSSDLHERLQARGIDTIIVTGTVTNVCCESTARDAMMLNYKVHFVADANAARTDEEHNAALSNMMLWFSDVRTTDELINLVQHRM